MIKAKVRSYKTIRRPLGLGWGTLRALVRVGLRILIALLPVLPLIAIVIVFLLPQTPHLRIAYTYTGTHQRPIYRTCQYIGIHGIVDIVGQDCPIVRIMGGTP